MSFSAPTLQEKLEEKQQQIACLLRITQAINLNESAEELFRMYEEFLGHHMHIERMAFYVEQEGQWQPVCSIPADDLQPCIEGEEMESFTQVTNLADHPPCPLSGYDYVVPVRHKDMSIAYALVSDSRSTQDRKNFITTISNIIAVAIENKRLFKRQIEQERYRKEVELASEVQKMLIPGKLPRNRHFELASIYRPQLNIGGDYYDYIELTEDRYLFCIADISGKGVGAALLMANFQATLRNALMHYDDLERLVRFLNHSLVSLTNSERIITLFLADYNASQGTLEYINAGHSPPFLIMDGEICRLIEGCTLLGAVDELPDISKTTIRLRGEALLMTYTDGLTDLRNDEGVYFDDYRISDFISRYAGLGVDAFNRHLLEELDAFKGEQDYPDDIAILTCKMYARDHIIQSGKAGN